MRVPAQSVTTLVDTPTQERRRRMVRYSVAMIIRVICIFLMLFVQGWLLVICAIGAIFLPYFAVILANAVTPPQRGTVDRPGGTLVPLSSRDD